jgi:hypothetical protein
MSPPPYGGADASESASLGVPPKVHQEGFARDVPVLQPIAGSTQPSSAARNAGEAALHGRRPGSRDVVGSVSCDLFCAVMQMPPAVNPPSKAAGCIGSPAGGEIRICAKKSQRQRNDNSPGSPSPHAPRDRAGWRNPGMVPIAADNKRGPVPRLFGTGSAAPRGGTFSTCRMRARARQDGILSPLFGDRQNTDNRRAKREWAWPLLCVYFLTAANRLPTASQSITL